MKKSIVSLVLLGSVLGSVPVLGTVTTIGNVSSQSTNSLITLKTAENNLTSISSANPEQFDNPSVGPNGVLERMPTTTINTKFGQMQIQQDSNGYTCKNLSNADAPILYVGAVNNIYEVGGAVDLESLITPTLYNQSGQKIKGTVILPNVDTTKPCFGETYVEAIGENGAITIAPFIYNTVQFKSSITPAELKNLTPQDVVTSDSTDLKAYTAQYKDGDKTAIVGVSRGMASLRKEIPVNNGQVSTTTQSNTQAKANVKKADVQPQVSTSYKMPLLIKILTNMWTYIIVGAILIAIISFICF